jgi:hypothetical protein
VNVNGTTVQVRALRADVFTRQPASDKAIQVWGYRLGSKIRLVGHRLETDEYAPGESLQLALYWQASSWPDRGYTVFVHIVDSSGKIAAQWDSQPRENNFPTTVWPVGEIIEDIHTIPLPPDMPPDEYQILVGMYDWQTGIRLLAYDRYGAEFADAAIVLAPISISAQQ